MAGVLTRGRPYERFSTGEHGLAPGVTVTLHLPASGRKIRGKRGLIDTKVAEGIAAISSATLAAR
jgi:hypothetical protein